MCILHCTYFEMVGTGYLSSIFSQGKRAWFVQPPSKAETNITDAKEDYSYQEKQNYQQEVNTSKNYSSYNVVRFTSFIYYHG